MKNTVMIYILLVKIFKLKGVQHPINCINQKTKQMKPSQLKMLEDLYNFLGANETLLKAEFKKSKELMPDVKKINFLQFCVITYSNLNETNKSK